jgi:hypothetical protein
MIEKAAMLGEGELLIGNRLFTCFGGEAALLFRFPEDFANAASSSEAVTMN